MVFLRTLYHKDTDRVSETIKSAEKYSYHLSMQFFSPKQDFWEEFNIFSKKQTQVNHLLSFSSRSDLTSVSHSW